MSGAFCRYIPGTCIVTCVSEQWQQGGDIWVPGISPGTYPVSALYQHLGLPSIPYGCQQSPPPLPPPVQPPAAPPPTSPPSTGWPTFPGTGPVVPVGGGGLGAPGSGPAPQPYWPPTPPPPPPPSDPHSPPEEVYPEPVPGYGQGLTTRPVSALRPIAGSDVGGYPPSLVSGSNISVHPSLSGLYGGATQPGPDPDMPPPEPPTYYGPPGISQPSYGTFGEDHSAHGPPVSYIDPITSQIHIGPSPDIYFQAGGTTFPGEAKDPRFTSDDTTKTDTHDRPVGGVKMRLPPPPGICNCNCELRVRFLRSYRKGQFWGGLARAVDQAIEARRQFQESACGGRMIMMRDGDELGAFAVADTSTPAGSTPVIFGYGVMFAIIMQYECKCRLQKQGKDLYYQKAHDYQLSTEPGKPGSWSGVTPEIKDPDTYEDGNASFIKKYQRVGAEVPYETPNPPSDICYSVWVDSPALCSRNKESLKTTNAVGKFAIPNHRIMFFGGLAIVKRHPDCPTPCNEQGASIYYQTEAWYDYDKASNELTIGGFAVEGQD